jgi:DNA-binding MarR family transcriptional regulator
MDLSGFIRLFNQYNRIHNQFTAVKRKMVCDYRGESLYPTELHVLTFLRDRPQATVTDIASFLYSTTSAASQMMKKLSQKKFIKKRRSAEEERVVVLSLTEKGVKAVRDFIDLESAMFRDIWDYLNGMSERQIQVIRRFLNTLEESFARKLQ